MNFAFKRIYITFLILFSFIASIQAQDEFKNSLVKVELNKKSDNSYNLDLYTQKKFSEPVKVIKKSDLNYYVLLPETKNQTSQASAKGEDIRNVSIDSHKYSASEDNTGYTKVNITTTKPINFNLNIKELSQSVSSNSGSSIASANTKASNSEAQKKKFTDAI